MVLVPPIVSPWCRPCISGRPPLTEILDPPLIIPIHHTAYTTSLATISRIEYQTLLYIFSHNNFHCTVRVDSCYHDIAVCENFNIRQKC